MAELAPQIRSSEARGLEPGSPPAGWTASQTRSQFAAIAWLRWRIAVNGLRRKGASGELVGRIFLVLTFASITVFLVAGAGIAAYFMSAHGRLSHIAWLLWGIFVLCQVLNIQLGQPGTTFDPTQLIRFPLRVDTYVAIRLFFGLLSPANIVGTLMSLAVAIGIGMAVPSLWMYALLALAVFAATNVLFSRMVFAWVDRWLSTRRAREVFTGLILAFSLGIQWANFTFNPAYNHGHAHPGNGISQQRIDFASNLYHRAQPFLAVFPPELSTTSLIAAHQSEIASFVGHVAACALFAALFLAVFAIRMRAEFRGESLSDAAGGVSQKAVKPSSTPKLTRAAAAPANEASMTASTFGVPPVIVSMLGKELLYVRRHMGILYGLVMPIFLVLIFAGRFASRTDSLWVFPGAVAYTLLAVCGSSYNAFGFEATGSQFYFLAPVRMRDVLLAKNLFGVLLACIEILAIFGIVSYMVGVPRMQTALAALLWAAGTLALSMIVGNRRSIAAPKKINAQRMSSRQASQLSMLLSMVVLAVSASLGIGLFSLCMGVHLQWALVPVFAVFAAAGIGIYIHSLGSLDRFALEHREELFAELCKQS